MRRDIVARTKVRQFNANSAYLHPQHALVLIGPTVGSAHLVLLVWAPVLALAAG